MSDPTQLPEPTELPDPTQLPDPIPIFGPTQFPDLSQKPFVTQVLYSPHIPEQIKTDSKLFQRRSLSVTMPRPADDLKRLTCPVCQKGFSCQKTKHNHVIQVHENAGRYRCGSCSKTFSDNYHKERHEISHTVRWSLFKPVAEFRKNLETI